MAETSGAGGAMETFKTLSTFLSSVVIALAGVTVTWQFNAQQLQLARQKADDDLKLARIREVAATIPKLGSDVAKERRFGAITLALLGESAIPALKAALGDDDYGVESASADSLALIGPAVIPEMEKTYGNRNAESRMRAMSLRVLGLLHADHAFDLATTALKSEREVVILREAAAVFGFLKDAKGVPVLLDALKQHSQPVVEAGLARNIVWSLDIIGDPHLVSALIPLLTHTDEPLRQQSVWALARTKTPEAIAAITHTAETDRSQTVREAARTAIEWSTGTAVR